MPVIVEAEFYLESGEENGPLLRILLLFLLHQISAPSLLWRMTLSLTVITLQLDILTRALAKNRCKLKYEMSRGSYT